jgi:hypothetical protein
MIALPAGARILLATKPVDFRKGALSPAALAAEAGKASPMLRDNQARRRRAGRGRLPAHLPRIDVVLAPKATSCPCCQGPLVEIGVDAAERLAGAIRYTLNHRDGLVRFLDDGRVELDNNTVERAIRPICLSRKNALFACGDEGGARSATVASLVETCKLNGVDPQHYFNNVLTRLVNGWPNNCIDELMPWCWAS